MNIIDILALTTIIIIMLYLTTFASLLSKTLQFKSFGSTFKVHIENLKKFKIFRFLDFSIFLLIFFKSALGLFGSGIVLRASKPCVFEIF